MILSNIVRKDELMEVRLKALEEVSEALRCSFGPMGSNTLILKDKKFNQYTKDGHTILSNIQLNGVIEQSIVEDLVTITHNIVKEIGDNTTSAVILSYLIFKEMIELVQNGTELPYSIISNFKVAVEKISEKVKEQGRSCTLDDIYNIAFTSTNGNTELAEKMYNIYKNYGMDVFIDVAVSNTGEDLIKEYDGLTLNTGYSDVAYVNVKGKGVCRLRNPQIYVFQDPVDTPEMMTLMDSILAHNIIGPMQQAHQQKTAPEYVPTVILTTRISRDLSSYMEQLLNIIYSTPEANRPPLLIVSNIYQEDQYLDIARMCNAKIITKYINVEQQRKDIEAGTAPTPSTVHTFGGQAELVEASVTTTKFVNPIGMHEVEDNGSDKYNSLIENIEGMIRAAKEDGKDPAFIGGLKRRLNSLKANMVEFLVGGVSASDRDMSRDLIEDAVLNCRSAATNGVGNGANFEALMASTILIDELPKDDPAMKYVDIIHKAYIEVTLLLYSTITNDKNVVAKMLDDSIKAGAPINLRTMKPDGTVLTSIQSDIATLETLSKILTLMITSNQSLLPNVGYNTYYSKERLENGLTEEEFTMAAPV